MSQFILASKYILNALVLGDENGFSVRERLYKDLAGRR